MPLTILNPDRTEPDLPVLLVQEENRRTAHWDARSGPRNYVALVSAQAAASLLALASTWMAARSLGPHGYGGVVALIAASQCLNHLALAWSSVSLVRFGCEEFVESGRVAKAFWTRLTLLLPNLLLVLVCAPWWLPPLGELLHLPGEARALVLFHLVATTVWIHVQQALQAAKLPRLAAALLGFERAQIFLSLAALAAVGKLSFLSAAWAYVLSPSLACAAGLWRLRPLLHTDRWLDLSLLRSMLRFSLPLIPYAAIGYFSTQHLDAIFITRFLSHAELGIYWVAYQLAGVMMQLPLAAGSLLLPYLITTQASRRDDGVERFFLDLLPALTLAWSTLCAVVAALACLILPLLFGPAFHGLERSLWPLLAACAVAGPNLVGFAPLSNARSATYIAALAALVAATVNLALNAFLIPRWGLAGCAWATLLAYVACLTAIAYLIRLRVGIRSSWIALALTPALGGAALAVWKPQGTIPIAGSLLIATLVAVRHRYAVGRAIDIGLGRSAPAGAALQDALRKPYAGHGAPR